MRRAAVLGPVLAAILLAGCAVPRVKADAAVVRTTIPGAPGVTVAVAGAGVAVSS
jgi:hypothetical protein